MADEPKLTGKQRAFVEAYVGVARYNGTEAARLAGYSDPRNSATANKRNAAIQAAISDTLKQKAIGPDEVLAELTTVAMAPVGEADLGAKLRALELVGKAHGLFTDRLDVSGSLTSRVELVGVDADDI